MIPKYDAPGPPTAEFFATSAISDPSGICLTAPASLEINQHVNDGSSDCESLLQFADGKVKCILCVSFRISQMHCEVGAHITKWISSITVGSDF
jgi:hypothetical protein